MVGGANNRSVDDIGDDKDFVCIGHWGAPYGNCSGGVEVDDAREADNAAPGVEDGGEDEEEGENEESRGDGSACNNRLFDGEHVGISLRRGATDGRCKEERVFGGAV
jgi:hypothetical protein